MNPAYQITHYQICLEGKLEERWLRWFEGLEITTGKDGHTVLSGAFDQSALHGLFNRIRDLGIPIISVQRFPDKIVSNQNKKENL